MDFSPQIIVLFLLLISNIIRFYHGNMRHLDTSYVTKCGSDDIKQTEGKKISKDFIVIFIQSLLFAAMSFYLVRPTEFFIIFTSLLIVDILWFLSVHENTNDRKLFEHQKKWTINNTIAIFSLLAIRGASNIVGSIWLFYLYALIIALNTIADFIINWDFYFPTIHLKNNPQAMESKIDRGS